MRLRTPVSARASARALSTAEQWKGQTFFSASDIACQALLARRARAAIMVFCPSSASLGSFLKNSWKNLGRRVL
jgi:hypothetical protein